MNVLKFSDKDFAARLAQLAAASSLFDPAVEERARGIIAAVRERGDAALLELTERFDGAQLTVEQLAVSQAEIFSASLAADDSLRAAVTEAEKNIADFAKKSLRKNWSARNSHGASVGEKFDGFGRVGIYIPGGTAPLVSTALMTITLARVAGCREIAVCTPPGRDGSVNPALLFAARTAGATEIYKAGGAQAIAALSLGTATIRPVQRSSAPAMPTSSLPSACSSGTSRLTSCPAPVRCSCSPTTPRTRSSSPPICSPKPSTAPATSASGW